MVEAVVKICLRETISFPQVFDLLVHRATLLFRSIVAHSVVAVSSSFDFISILRLAAPRVTLPF
jgi:hypothetical protein